MEAVDRLVPTLDQILLTLERAARLQRATTVIAALVFIGVSVILAYDLTFAARSRERMEDRIEQLRDANAELRTIADGLSDKLAATKRSVDATQKSVEAQPEVQIVPKDDGGSAAVLVIHPQTPRATSSTAPATPVSIPLQLPSGTRVTPPPVPQSDD